MPKAPSKPPGKLKSVPPVSSDSTAHAQTDDANVETQPAIDEATVHRIAHLSRIKVSPAEADNLKRELNGILSFVAELNAIPTEGVAPLTSIGPAHLPMRHDTVTDGGRVTDIMKNAPKSEDHFFLVPKVIE